jgi:hypothetical protein
VFVAVNTSPPEVDRVHPLLDAIAGFREAVNRLIDEHKAGLLHKALEAEAEPPLDAFGPRLPSMESAAGGRFEQAVTSRTWPAPQTSPKAGPEPLLPSRPQGSISEVAGTYGTEPNLTQHPDDPRQRLEALAKLLDKRRKPAGPAGTDSLACAGED